MQWGPISPTKWPQETLRIPQAGGRFMPPIYGANAIVDGSESFTMSGTFNLGAATVAGQVFNLFLPTDQDGDFWCDQIYAVAWDPAGERGPARPWSGDVTITDARTSRSLNFPTPIAGEFFSSFARFADDLGFDVASSPLPDGFRSTATIPTPFCFTRDGGIQLTYRTPVALVAFGVMTIDFSFSGWKEYAHASGR